MDGTVQINFSAFATSNGSLSAGYNRSTHGCASTYCHGGFGGGNAGNAPVWTAGASAAACGTCHGNTSATPSALPTGHVALAAGSTNATCRVCHPATVKADGTIDVAGGKHMNGVVQADTDPAATHPAGWLVKGNASFHGNAAIADQSPCFRCHAWELPARVTTVICWGCHQIITNPSP
jgi:predicted CxxxxCH...CXXCH cytochrome family protein